MSICVIRISVLIKTTITMKILIGPIEIAGFARSLAEGLSSHNVIAHTVDFGGHPFRYESNITQTSKVLEFCDNVTRFVKNQRALKIVDKYCKILGFLRFFVFLLAISRYNVVIYLGAGSFLPWKIDLKILKFSGKKIICIFMGSDSRPLAINGAMYHLFVNKGIVDMKKFIRYSRRQLSDIARIEKYTDLVICAPLSGQALNRDFVNWFYLGFPVAAPQTPKVFPETSDYLRLLHAPSSRHYKGSEIIQSTVKRLQDSGMNIKYTEITGRPNREVLAAISENHIIIDELYSDTGLAGLGVEASSLGRIVIVGGNGWNCLTQYLPTDMQFPSIMITPDDLEQTIVAMYQSRHQLDSLAKKHYDFIFTRWNNKAVACRFLEWISNGVPNNAMISPATINYVNGVGASVETITEVLTQLLHVFTPGQLGFHHAIGSRALLSLVNHENASN